MLATGLVVLNTAIKSITRVRLNRMTRSIADSYIAQWSRRMLKVIDLNISTVKFARPITFEPERCYIIMSNHASHYDIPIIFQTLPGSIRMLAKKELFTIPFFGRMLRENEFPSVDRENRRQAIKDLEIAEKIMRSGIVLWVAPEGTRSRHPTYLGKFKHGGFILALKSKAIIIPVGIRGSANILPSHTWNFSLGETVEVHVGEPIETANFANKEQLLEYVEDQISHLAEVPKFSEHV